MATSPLRIGIIGAGSRGIECFGKLIQKRDDAVVVALADPNHLRMGHHRDILDSEPTCYADAETMLEQEQLDGVIVTSPDYCHEDHTVMALERGVNVLIDKPLAISVKGCQRVMRTAQAENTIAMIGFNLRHMPVLQTLKRVVDEGQLGRVFLIENREFYDGGRTYMSRWNRLKRFSGGLWIHKGSHDFDIFNWLLGHPKPLRVSASAQVNVFRPDQLPFELKDGIPAGPTCGACAYKDICPDVYDLKGLPQWTGDVTEVDGYQRDLCMYLSDKDTHDNGIALVEYEGGIRASHMECFVTSINDRRYTVIGDRGIAEASLHDMKVTVNPRWSKEKIEIDVPEVEGGHGGADPQLLAQFLQAIQGGGDGAATLEQGLWATAIGQAAELSVERGAFVDISELTGDPV